MGQINQLVKEAHATALEHGWWTTEDEPQKYFGELIALVHSEASEALEEYRDNREPNYSYIGQNGKPCGIPSELADIVIRVMDMCGYYEIDLEEAILTKMGYNATKRSWRHGGKRI